MIWAGEWELATGLRGHSHSITCLIEIDSNKRLLFDIPLPFWLRIGPINWEGKY